MKSFAACFKTHTDSKFHRGRERDGESKRAGARMRREWKKALLEPCNIPNIILFGVLYLVDLDVRIER